MLDGKTVLVTGGAGSFGTAFVERVLTHDIRRVFCYSRDEWKHQQLRDRVSDNRLRCLLGDVRDRGRLELAMESVDYVVHAAALKRVDVGEFEPEEFKKTNIDGTYNVCHAARLSGVQKVVYLSTDKSSAPSTSYGSSKYAGEHAVRSFGAYRSAVRNTLFACTRYGNVMGSRGSVIPHFRLLASHGAPLPITSTDMTRFWMTQAEAVDLVLLALKEMQGGEVFIPKLPAFKITDLAEAIDPGGDRELIGIRQAEKIHESLISPDEAQHAWDGGDFYVLSQRDDIDGGSVPREFQYSSDMARRLSVDDLRERLKHV